MTKWVAGVLMFSHTHFGCDEFFTLEGKLLHDKARTRLISRSLGTRLARSPGSVKITRLNYTTGFENFILIYLYSTSNLWNCCEILHTATLYQCTATFFHSSIQRINCCLDTQGTLVLCLAPLVGLCK